MDSILSMIREAWIFDNLPSCFWACQQREESSPSDTKILAYLFGSMDTPGFDIFFGLGDIFQVFIS